MATPLKRSESVRRQNLKKFNKLRIRSFLKHWLVIPWSIWIRFLQLDELPLVLLKVWQGRLPLLSKKMILIKLKCQRVRLKSIKRARIIMEIAQNKPYLKSSAAIHQRSNIIMVSRWHKSKSLQKKEGNLLTSQD